MPAEFEKCQREGGEIRTKRIDSEHYMHVCIPKGKGKGDSIAGEVKQYKKLSGRKTPTKK